MQLFLHKLEWYMPATHQDCEKWHKVKVYWGSDFVEM